jgi:uncharacterized metal-binding protein
MSKSPEPRCASCNKKDCKSGKDCYDNRERMQALYDDDRIAGISRAASAIEARHYRKENRLSEIILFAKELGVKKVGLAFCVGLASEAETAAEILKQHFDVVSVCCKVCGINKKDFGLEQIRPEDDIEVMCNPAGQAEMLNDAETGLNIVCGLCVGHDSIFYMKSKAPVTTFITKDRVLGHNPAAALYVQYIRRGLLNK